MREPIRWEAGDRLYKEASWLPGLFVFVYAAVIGWKWLVRLLSPRQRRG